MNILHLTKKDYTTSAWSGGTTTELFIWPRGASYASREFDFRVSSAVVELAESEFTPLVGVERWITPLSGGFTLTHPGREPVVMGPLSEPYRFSGETATHCVGRATDFNLMCKGVAGEMSLKRGVAAVRPGFNGFYALQKTACILEGNTYCLEAGDLLAVLSPKEAAIDLGQELWLNCWAEMK